MRSLVASITRVCAVCRLPDLILTYCVYSAVTSQVKHAAHLFGIKYYMAHDK